MEITKTSARIHPLMAGAAVAVTLVSVLGIAAITGVLPNSHGSATGAEPLATQTTAVAPVSTPTQQLATARTVGDEATEHKPVVHHHHVQHAQSESDQQYAQAPVYQQPAAAPAPVAHNSALGIGVGAVVGGLLGNQVGGGNGKTLATIAGAVGGGYVGNEVAKRNP